MVAPDAAGGAHHSLGLAVRQRAQHSCGPGAHFALVWSSQPSLVLGRRPLGPGAHHPHSLLLGPRSTHARALMMKEMALVVDSRRRCVCEGNAKECPRRHAASNRCPPCCRRRRYAVTTMIRPRLSSALTEKKQVARTGLRLVTALYLAKNKLRARVLSRETLASRKTVYRR